MKKILALIPARAGSKRIPGKNKKLLGGKPLIQWTIDLALQLENIAEILVSTDDPEIQEIALKAGVSAPWLRPEEYSTDYASSADVILHGLEWYESRDENYDAVLLLQPTSPFRVLSDIQKGVNRFLKNSENLVGVSECRDHPAWALKLVDDHIVPYCQNNEIGKRSQDLSKAYVVNGSFYLFKTSYLKENNEIPIQSCFPIIFNGFEYRIDLDNENDWNRAKNILKLNKEECLYE